MPTPVCRSTISRRRFAGGNNGAAQHDGPSVHSGNRNACNPCAEAGISTCREIMEKLTSAINAMSVINSMVMGERLRRISPMKGSRAPRRWMADFLKNPQTLRPTLTFRMPQFNITDKRRTFLQTISQWYCKATSRRAAMNVQPFTPAQAATGKQLYEVKYQCQSCHTIGSSGGYVGPNLSNAGKLAECGMD